jgi:hypothetical protein
VSGNGPQPLIPNGENDDQISSNYRVNSMPVKMADIVQIPIEALQAIEHHQ